ncbi:unannotated protein [freshwater metagenome]|uniref:Unannotated protein n=1 Tax=freshwater metagenome TaxID=449393 RepID=A0A6J6R8B5_9ZZZZ
MKVAWLGVHVPLLAVSVLPPFTTPEIQGLSTLAALAVVSGLGSEMSMPLTSLPFTVTAPAWAWVPAEG